MRFKLIACDVLLREVAFCVAKSPHTVDMAFTPKEEHNESERLRATLQRHVDATAEAPLPYDAVLLAYGLCGNSTAGLVAKGCPLVIPRAHDCTTLFLGSKAAFSEHFGDNPSQCWASVGYAERGESVFADSDTRAWLNPGQSYEEMVELYGEENAAFMMEALGGKPGSEGVYFLDVPETRVEAIVERIRSEAERQGKEFREIPGSLRLIDRLVSGDWPKEEFLVVPPGKRVAARYDWDEVIASEPPE